MIVLHQGEKNNYVVAVCCVFNYSYIKNYAKVSTVLSLVIKVTVLKAQIL